MRPRKHRIGDEELRRGLEKEQENKRQIDVNIKRLDREIKMLRYNILVIIFRLILFRPHI